MYCSYYEAFRRRWFQITVVDSPRNPPTISIPTSIKDEVRVTTNDWWNSSANANRIITIMEYDAQRHVFMSVELFLKARNRRRPRTKYSVTCASLRITPWIKWTFASERAGIKNRSIGSMNLEVFEDAKAPLDIQNVKLTQRMTGSQYFKKKLWLFFITQVSG